jgi:ABC-type sugar transport system, periplasmic component
MDYRQSKSRSRLPLRIVVCLAGLLVLLSFGCRSKEPTVAVIPRTCGTFLWEAEHTGVMREASRYGVNIYWNAPMREDDVQGQIEMLAKAVMQKRSGLIVSPIEDLPLRTPLLRAVRAGIPVVVVGTDLGIAPSGHLVYVLNDEQAGAQLAARRIGKILKGRGTVAILGINKKLSSTAQRALFFENVLTSEFPDIHVTFRSLGLPTVSQEQQTAERLLARSPRPDALVALSEHATRGAFLALVESNQLSSIRLVGFDQNELAPIRTREIDSVIIQDTNEMGRAAMTLMLKQMNNQPSQSRVVVEPELVTPETIDAPRVRESLDLHYWLN